VVETKLNMM